jgi:hypothetical protein
VRFRQRAVIKFLETEKELVTNIHKRLKSLNGANAVDKSTISLWASRTASFAKDKVDLADARRSDGPTAAVTQSCFNVLIKSLENDRQITIRKLATEHMYVTQLKTAAGYGTSKNRKPSY